LESLLCEVLPGVGGGTRARLLEVLARLKPDGAEALRELVKALEDEMPWIREPARLHLWHAVGDRPDLIEHIVAFTHEEDPQVRSAAHEALRVLGQPTAEALTRLARQLESEDKAQRATAIGELRILGRRAAGLLPELLSRLPDLEPAARAAVLSVLGPLSGATLTPALRAVLTAGLEDADAQVREAAVWALHDFDGWEDNLRMHVEARRKDPEPRVREAVEATLGAARMDATRAPLSIGTEEPEYAAWALREFALTLYERLREGEGNRVFSPLSVFTLLALVLRGTRGHTEAALRQALHWDLEPSRLSSALRALAQRLHVPTPQEPTPHIKDEGFTLVSANGFWPQQGYPLREEYVAELAQSFGVRTTEVDFAGAPEAASQVLNAWASEQTRGRIPAIAPSKGLPPATRYVLANAVYFRSRWEKPFDDTRDGPFHLLDGRQVEVPMMGRQARFGYARGAGHQLIELPYLGRQASMVVLLPDTGFFERFERLLSSQRLDTLLAQRTWEDFVLRLPRFHLDQHVDLTRLAERLGLSALFEPDADLSGMTPAREPFAGNLLHDATLTVDEKGTEAAAVTRMYHIGGVPPVVEVNRPFLFLIRHLETGAVLFLGRVMDPRAPSAEPGRPT
ncbi:MAG TPA: serpin family protein, partial [Myxococcaceae bacterium]